MTKILQLHPGRSTTGDDAHEAMDAWKADMPKHSKVVIIYSDESGAYNTFAINCNMAEAVGYAAFAQEMLLNQVRPE